MGSRHCGGLRGLLALSGCGTGEQPGAASPEEQAKVIYTGFLEGNGVQLDEEQAAMWWVPNFQGSELRYEYTLLDLSRDGVPELLVQLAEDPGGYNGVFHTEDGKLYCWNSDAAEMTCLDYPLNDGTMVRDYTFGGTRSYTIFRYTAAGETEELASFFAREERIPEDSPEPCPYYRVGETEVTRAEFETALQEQIGDHLLDRSAWNAI